jgi:hypothetical protein
MPVTTVGCGNLRNDFELSRMISGPTTNRTLSLLGPRCSLISVGVRSMCANEGPSRLRRLVVVKTIRTVIPGAVGVLLSMLAAAQGLIASDQPTSSTGVPVEPMMMPVPYADEMYPVFRAAPTLPYAPCYRIGRCSATDLYRFRDRPNRLTRLAPEAPPGSVAWSGAVRYTWSLVPVTPEENIVPKYRTASQLRDEYRAVSRSSDGPN